MPFSCDKNSYPVYNTSSIVLISNSVACKAGKDFNSPCTPLLLPVIGNKVRLASEKDFEDFRCVFEGYKNNPEYEYQK